MSRSSDPAPDYYDRLGVCPSASQTAIERAFRRRAKETHPDRNPDDPEAAARFRRIREAHEVLSDPERRASYDAQRTAPSPTVPSTLTASSLDETGCVTYYLPRVGVGLLAVLAFLILEAFGVWRAEDPETVFWGVVGASVVTGGVAVALLRWLPDAPDPYAVRFGPDAVRVWLDNRLRARIPWTDVDDWHLHPNQAVLDLTVRAGADPGAAVAPVLDVRAEDDDTHTLRLDLTGTDVQRPILQQFLRDR